MIVTQHGVIPMAEKADTKEIAVPVSEAPEAPGTVAPEASEDAPKKRAKLSYDVGSIPNPATSHDQFVHAQLVEARATRVALEKIAASLEEIVHALSKGQ